MRRSNSPADGVIATRQKEMAAFDRLPPTLRQALTQTRIQWSALSVELLMREQHWSADRTLARLLELDAKA